MGTVCAVRSAWVPAASERNALGKLCVLRLVPFLLECCLALYQRCRYRTGAVYMNGTKRVEQVRRRVTAGTLLLERWVLPRRAGQVTRCWGAVGTRTGTKQTP